MTSRSDKVLEPVASEIWLMEGENVDFYGFPYPTRGVLVRLPDGALWVWSPVALTEERRRAIDGLGPVGHLVSPNKLHHLFLADWHRAYPEARLWGPASTVRKRKDLHFEPPLEDKAPAAWNDAIDQAWFRGSPVFDEIVFFHRPSRTAIIGDLSENLSAAFLEAHWRPWHRTLARLWKITEGHGLAPLELRLSWLGRQAGRQARQKLLSWQAERVIMAHGEWQRAGGQAYLERVFAWLGP